MEPRFHIQFWMEQKNTHLYFIELIHCCLAVHVVPCQWHLICAMIIVVWYFHYCGRAYRVIVVDHREMGREKKRERLKSLIYFNEIKSNSNNCQTMKFSNVVHFTFGVLDFNFECTRIIGFIYGCFSVCHIKGWSIDLNQNCQLWKVKE